MFTTSSAYKSKIRQSHRAIIKAEVWSGESKILDLEPLAGSSIDIDSRRSVRRTCSLNVASEDPYTIIARGEGAIYSDIADTYATYTLINGAFPNYGLIAYTGQTQIITVDPGIITESAASALAPFGNEIRLWRGIEVTQDVPKYYAELNTGQLYSALAASFISYSQAAFSELTQTVEELIPLGIFRISDVEVEDGSGTSISIRGNDRSSIISRNKWTQPFSIAAGTNLGTALQTLLSDRWDDVAFRFEETSITTNQAIFGTASGNDPWKDAVGMAEAFGFDLYFGGDGICVLASVRDFSNATPDAAYLEDSQAMVLNVQRSLSNAETFNGVIVTGEGSGNDDVYRGEVWDDDPTSPTYISGKFGLVPFFYSSPLILSNSQAVATASALLSLKKGATENVQWTQITDPSLDAGDVIALTNSGSKVDRMLVIDRLTIPLESGSPMSAISRTVRSLNGETFLDLVAS